jgi:hypothetical protein
MDLTAARLFPPSSFSFAVAIVTFIFACISSKRASCISIVLWMCFRAIWEFSSCWDNFAAVLRAGAEEDHDTVLEEGAAAAFSFFALLLLLFLIPNPDFFSVD